jgi:hypothetical protein
MAMVAPRFDDSKWPLYRVYLPKGDMDDREFSAFLETLDGLYLRGQKFGVMLDAREAPPLSPKRRQMTGERGKEMSARYPGLLLGFAVVLSSAVQRGIFTAIQWVVRGAFPSRAFGTLGEAEAWLTSMLKAGGIDAPPPSR